MIKHSFYRICMLWVMALLFASCVDDSIIEDDVVEEKPVVGASGNNVSFTLSLPLENLHTRATATEAQREMLVDGVRIVLYRGNFVNYYWDLDIKTALNDSGNIVASGADVIDATEDTDNNVYQIITKARQAEMDSYDMLVIVNPNKGIKAVTAAGVQLNKLKEAFNTTLEDNRMYRLAGDDINGVTEGDPVYFLMLNAKGLVAITEENFFNSAANAEAKPVTDCYLERATAKINLFYGGPTDDSPSTTPNEDGGYTPPNTGRFVMDLGFRGSLYGFDNLTTDFDIPDDYCDSEGYALCPFCRGIHKDTGTGTITSHNTLNRVTKTCEARTLTVDGKEINIKSCGYIYGSGDALSTVTTKVRYMVASDLTWAMDIVNKKSYWYRQMTKKSNGVQETTEEGVATPEGVDIRSSFYAEDPNFADFAEKGSDDLADEFTYLTTETFATSAQKLDPYKDAPYAGYWSPRTEDDAPNLPVYLPENTMTQAEQKRNVVTRAIVKVTLKRENIGNEARGYTLDKFVNKGLEDITTYPMGDFFVFLGGDTNGKAQYNADSKGKYFILHPEDVAYFREANAVIPDYLQASGYTTITDAIAEFVADHSSFDWKTLSNNETPLQSPHLLFYKNGEMYYEVPVQHFTTTQVGKGGYGRFGVVRNNWYKLDVQTILSLGLPTIPAADATTIENLPAVNSSLPLGPVYTDSWIRQ